MRGFLRYWHDPGYWRWRWDKITGGTRAGLVVMLALSFGLGGYYTAAVLADSTEPTAAHVSPTQKIVTRVQTVAVSAPGQTVTEQVTVQQAGRERGVTNRQTVVQSQTVEWPVTVTDAITRTVTGPTRTVSGPTATVTNQVLRVVTGPTQTVTNRISSPTRSVTVTSPSETVTGPTETVTRTVTQPSPTVTETITNAVTVAVTVAATKPPKK